MRRLPVALLLLLGVAASWGARGRLERVVASGPATEELLYLPNGKYLKVASVGQAPLLADLIYLWAIQYYSDYTREGRYRYVEHIFGEVIPELDPHYTDAYWLGALILTVEAGELEGGLRLLDKGFEANPRAWVLPYLAGWECHRVRDYRRAAEYFARATRVEDAPSFVLRTRAGMIARAGDLREAIRLWREVLYDPRSDDAARAIAERWLRDLKIEQDVTDLERAVRAFREQKDRYPFSLRELLAARFIRELPIDPHGREYRYDPRTGSVSSTAGRVLGES